jgi:hypothetical protein
MGADVFTAITGGAALLYAAGRLWRANRHETEREREMRARYAALDETIGVSDRIEAATTDMGAYEKGFLDGVSIPRPTEPRKSWREQRAAAQAR